MRPTDEIALGRCAHLSDVELKIAFRRLGVLPSEIDGPPVALLIGEAPSPNGHGREPFAMFPWPATSAAGRLLKMSGMPAAVYLGRFERRNLLAECPDSWSIVAARERADEMREWIRGFGNCRILTLGSKVSAAFGLVGFFQPPLVVRHEDDEGGFSQEWVAIPHPSGLNRKYNTPEVARGTRGAMLWAAGLT